MFFVCGTSLLAAGDSALAAHRERPRWSVPLYLFLATLPCDTLSAFLAFCDRVVYPSYLATPRRFGISPLGDQELAGALMWVCVTFIYLLPAVIVTVELLSPSSHADVAAAREFDVSRICAERSKNQ